MNPSFNHKTHNYLIKYGLLLLLLQVYSCKYFEAEPIDHTEYVATFIEKAEHIYNPKKAFQYLDSVLQTIDKPGYEDRYMINFFKQRKYLSLASKENRKTNLNKALVYADSMAYWTNQNKASNKYNKQIAQCYLSKGDVLFEMKRYSLAYKNYFFGKSILKNYTKSRIRVNYRLASVAYISGKYRQAAALYLEACTDEVNDRGDFMGFSNTQTYLDNAGLSYANAKMPDSARFYYHKALKYISDNETKFNNESEFIKCARGIIYGNLADVFFEEYNYPAAEFYFKKSIRFNAAPRVDLHFLQGTRMGLAMLYLKLGKVNSAKAIMNEVELDIIKFPDELPKLKWKRLQIDYLNRTGQNEKAGKLISDYVKLNRELSTDKLEVVNTDINADFFNLQKEYELNLLKKDNQLAILFSVIVSILTITSIIILFQIWKSWKTSKKNNTHLLLLNDQLNDQNLRLQKILSALEKSQEENEKVMGVVAHDLRSPISAIVSLAGLMMSDKSLREEDQQMMSLIKNSGSDSLKFIDGLLSKEIQTEELEEEFVDLDALLNYCVNILLYKAAEKDQKITLKSKSISFNFNREKIWRVISNLIANAIKFSPNKTNIEVQSHVFSNHVRVLVIDQGIGIPDNMKNTIFNFGDIWKRSGTNGEKSYGMGLAISKQIVEAHGGKIWFENNELKGTTFFVDLPK